MIHPAVGLGLWISHHAWDQIVNICSSVSHVLEVNVKMNLKQLYAVSQFLYIFFLMYLLWTPTTETTCKVISKSSFTTLMDEATHWWTWSLPPGLLGCLPWRCTPALCTRLLYLAFQSKPCIPYWQPDLELFCCSAGAPQRRRSSWWQDAPRWRGGCGTLCPTTDFESPPELRLRSTESDEWQWTQHGELSLCVVQRATCVVGDGDVVALGAVGPGCHFEGHLGAHRQTRYVHCLPRFIRVVHLQRALKQRAVGTRNRSTLLKLVLLAKSKNLMPCWFLFSLYYM